MGLQARGCGGVDSDSVGGTWDISNADRLGKSEVELVNIFIEGVAQIIQWEKKLEAGEDIETELPKPQPKTVSYPPTGLAESIKKLPEWIQAGCGNDEYYCEEKGATFLGEKMPDELPDISNHSSFFAEAMRSNPDLYQQLKDKKTALGVTLGHCIKTGIDNPGHPHIKTVGMVAGDEESYELFAPLFDPVISSRHNGYGPEAQHPTDLDVSKLSKRPIDPTGKYILTTRCRTGRSVRGFRLPPCTSFEERRELESVIVKSLLSLEGDLKGDYFPLHGSQSYADKPNGMSLEKEDQLRSNGNLFQEPDSTLLLSSGCGRHWPDARGIFHNDNENLFVWVNEEDQMRIVSMEKGDNIRAIIERFSTATKTIQDCLQQQGHDFMHNDHLGWILTCPSNLGTGLRAGAMVKVPLFSSRADFKSVLGSMGLQARGCGGVDSASVGGTWDISNADRLGKSEVELVNIFIEGVAQIIEWEQMLEQGKSIEKLVYPPEIVYGLAQPDDPFTFTKPMQPQVCKEGDKVFFEVELSHNKEVTFLRGRGRCQVGNHYEIISVGLRRTLIIKGAEWNDEATFSCVTEDDEKCSAKLSVILAEKKKKVEKPKKVEEKRIEFDDKKSYSLVESLFELKKSEQPSEETETQSVPFYQPQSEIEGQYTPEALSCERGMALPYLQISDPVRDAIPKVPCWRKWSDVKKQHLMHDWSKEIDKMESEWAKRKNNQAEKHAMEVDKQRAKAELDSTTVQDRLASKINHDFELDQPIPADRGDPYALQRTVEHRQRVENFVKRVNKTYRLMDDVEQVSVFQKSFLDNYLEREFARDRYNYIEKDYVDNSKNIGRRLNKLRMRHDDMLKELVTTTKSVSRTLGFSIDI